jgi:Family of unknown function (DUF6529)
VVNTAADVDPESTIAEIRRARGNVAWVVGSLVVFGGWIALANAVPATDANQFKVKSWLALTAVVGSIVQLATISRVYDWTKRIPPGAVTVMAAIHRWSGRVTLIVGGAVMYMCITGPFASGFTTHRLVGYLLATVIVVKVVVLRANRFSGLLPYLGVLAIAGWLTCFLTKGFSVVF